MAWVGRLTDRLAPRVEDPELQSRFRFGVQAWLIAWPMAVVWTGVSAALGLWVAAALNFVMVVVGPIAVLGMKRTARLTPWFQLTLGAALLLYGPGMLGQTPADETGLFFAVIIPLVAGFMFGGRSAAWWTVLTATVSITSLTLAYKGYTLPASDPTPLFSKALNIVSALSMAALFAARFHEVRREGLERAQAANHAKSLFLASISHEIRTPMNGVLGMTEVMLQEAKDPVAREQLEVIQRSGKLLVSLINDLLDVTKLEAQRLKLEEHDFDLQELLSDVGLLFSPLAKDKGISLELMLEAGLATARRGDSLRLRQVLVNLISNGIKFTERGAVRVSVKRGEGDQVSFEVADTGIGIPSHVQSRLFSVFEQGDASTTRRFGGTGLGLALARQLVSLMGGTLNMDSKEGAGSTFSFTIGLGAGKPVSTRAARMLTPSTTAPRVLVVDDNAINLKVATSLVRKAGYEVDSVSNGALAVQAAMTTRYHAVLMDCHMPEMDGFEATARIRKLPGPFGEVPVIALTASTSEEDLAACRRSGMQEVLSKPVSMEVLVRALKACRASTPKLSIVS